MPEKTAQIYDSGEKRAVLGGIVNLLLALIKITTGIIGNTYALIADGIESLVDVIGSIILWSGLKIASRPPDTNHPYGHGKAESVSALILSIGLFAAAIFIAIQSINEIMHARMAPAGYTLFVLVGVILVKETLFRVFMKTGKEINSTAVETDAWHQRSDAITSAAAFIGISIAIIGGKGYEAADDWFALLACLVIGWSASRLLKRAASEMMDESPPAILEEKVCSIASSVSGVELVEKCLIRKSGLNYLIDLHVEVDGNMSVNEGHRIAHEVKNRLMRSDLSVQDVLVHIEPAGNPFKITSL